MWHAQQKYVISCFGCCSFEWKTFPAVPKPSLSPSEKIEKAKLQFPVMILTRDIFFKCLWVPSLNSNIGFGKLPREAIKPITSFWRMSGSRRPKPYKTFFHLRISSGLKLPLPCPRRGGRRSPWAVAKVGLELTEFLAGLLQRKPELRSQRRFSMSFDVALLRTHPQSSTWGFKGCCDLQERD